VDEQATNIEPDQSEPLLPVRAVSEVAFCPRLFYLEWVQGEWDANEHTAQGKLVHRNVEAESGSLPAADELAPEDRVLARSVLLSSDKHGIIGRLDLVEGENGSVRPVDYKKGSPSPGGPWLPEKVQLCLQGLILRENGYTCNEGVVYYAQTRSRHIVPFDDDLIESALSAIREARRLAAEPVPPAPLVDSPKCSGCSLVGICLPDEVTLLRGEPLKEIRRLITARDDRAPLYVVEQGATVGKKGERIVVRVPSKEDISVRMIDLSHVALYGNVQITAQALRACAERDIPIFHHTYGGWLVSVTSGVLGINIGLRVRQFALYQDEEAALPIAKQLVIGKLKNQRTMLRRNASGLEGNVLEEFTRLIRLANDAHSTQQLLGIEGIGGRIYFSQFSKMLKVENGFELDGRNKRPPRDPVNAVLSLTYSLLVKDCLAALLAVGLDPYCGLYHAIRPGRPALALDLMEEFRPLIADSVTIQVFNTKVVGESDFKYRGGAVAMSDNARRAVIRAYEKRMETLARHPLFGYQASYRRTLAIQARLLARAISGEIERYKAYTTR
jgi:CRISPR-associated protein Cas1